MSGDEYREGLQADLKRWRAALEAPPAGLDDQARSMIASWLKEGQRLLDRVA